MQQGVYRFLGIKPAEVGIVKKLFLVQLLLGVATAFLFTCTLTLFLHRFGAEEIPKVYLLSAALLFLANWCYARLEHVLSTHKLLQIITIFSAVTIFFTWLSILFVPINWIPFLLSAWNLVLYMLVGYAFWGMAAIIFNVRESKRLFSLVGAGDLPAKLLGYALVPLLIPYLGVHNLFWFSILAFLGALYFLRRFKHPAIEAPVSHQERFRVPAMSAESPALTRFFHNRLILFIALFSLVGFIIYALIDYTILAEVKSRFSDAPELAIFLGVFFACGRVLAIFFKVILSNRVIKRLGLTNVLLISPVVLLFLTGLVFAFRYNSMGMLYAFGVMVLLSEVLKSVVQEPAFFILFQPLQQHVRLKGHLIAKGYMMPFALMISGLFLIAYRELYGAISLMTMAGVLLVLLLVWVASVYFVKKAYLHTLVKSISKGWFTGNELFLNEPAVKEMLLLKTESGNPKEVAMALELLERSGYREIMPLLKQQLSSPFAEVKKYVLGRLLVKDASGLIPIIKQELNQNPEGDLKLQLVKAYFHLTPEITQSDKVWLQSLTDEEKKQAYIGMLLRDEPNAHHLVHDELAKLVGGRTSQNEKKLVLEVIAASPHQNFQALLASLLSASSVSICKLAIEVVGKAKVYNLLNLAMEKTVNRHLYLAFQNCLVGFGDPVFGMHVLAPEHLDPKIIKYAVAAAGKVKGESSEQFLLNLLQHNVQHGNEVVEAIWRKNTTLTDNGIKLVEGWLYKKLDEIRSKIDAHEKLQTAPQLALLTEALYNEVRQDTFKVLKGLALCYDRHRIDRVSKLLELKRKRRLANAIEMLEHIVPPQLFNKVEYLIDFILDGNISNKKLSGINYAALLEAIIVGEINCTIWTKSVACYLLPQVSIPAVTNILSDGKPMPDDAIFQETRRFVLASIP